ncbi:MAG TPA: regulator, partial [bacterium]
MKRLLWILLTKTMLLAWSSAVNADWQPTAGPYGGVVYAFHVNGSNIFAGMQSGVFLSTNNGATWTMRNSGMMRYNRVSSFAQTGANLFAGNNHGVYLTTDNGANWSDKSSGLPGGTAALALIGSNLYAGNSSGVYLTTDGGTNWAEVNSGLSSKNVQALA